MPNTASASVLPRTCAIPQSSRVIVMPFACFSHAAMLAAVCAEATDAVAIASTSAIFFICPPSWNVPSISGSSPQSPVPSPQLHLRPRRQRPNELVQKLQPVVVRLHADLLVAAVHVALLAFVHEAAHAERRDSDFAHVPPVRR